MMSLIECFDNDLKKELIAKDFIMLKDDGKTSIFVMGKAKFDFSKFDKTKYRLTNRLTF